jgi:hypothetical protein
MLDEGGFARARMADYPHQLPVRNGDVYVVDGDFFKGRAGAVNVAQAFRLYDSDMANVP